MKLRYGFILFLFIAMLGCNTNIAENNFAVCFLGSRGIKVYQLDFNNRNVIKKMNNCFVEVTGYFYYGFEESGIYSRKPSFLQNANALWVSNIYNNDTLVYNQLLKANGKKITLFGKIDTSNKGHLEYYMASLDSVFFVKEQ